MRLARWETIDDQYDARREAMQAKGRVDSVYKPTPPGQLYLDDAAWSKATADVRLVQFSVLPQPLGPGVTDASGRMGRNFAPERQQESVSLFAALADHIKAQRSEGHVLIASYSEGARDRLMGLLEDQDVVGATEIADFRDIPEGRGGLYLAVWALEHGFRAPDGLTVISEQDVLGDR